MIVLDPVGRFWVHCYARPRNLQGWTPAWRGPELCGDPLYHVYMLPVLHCDSRPWRDFQVPVCRSRIPRRVVDIPSLFRLKQTRC